MNKKVAYFTNIAPHYREKLWLGLAGSQKMEFHFFFGHSGSGIKEMNFDADEWKDYKNNLHKVRNIRLRGRLVFQTGVITKILFRKWDVIIFLGDANLVSNWIGVTLARLKGVKVAYWGHGLYGQERGLSKWLRLLFLSMANANLTYGEWAKSKMTKEGFKASTIKVIYNSLDYQTSRKIRDHVVQQDYLYEKGIFKTKAPILLFIGRLTPQKKLDILIDAVGKLKNNGLHFNLLIIGDGPERSKLERMATENGISCYFYGECYDEMTNASLIANADLCVSPGNVGLTAIHSLSYGTPLCTHNNFANQMPEFEAIEEGVTGCYFDEKKKNIEQAIERWFAKKPDREQVRKDCYFVIDEKYNPNVQVKIMEEMVNELA